MKKVILYIRLVRELALLALVGGKLTVFIVQVVIPALNYLFKNEKLHFKDSSWKRKVCFSPAP
jgi:hypothetical protein